MAKTDAGVYDTANEELFSPIEKARLPIEYMAKLFSAGNVEPVRLALKKQYAVRLFKRLETVGDMDAGVVQNALAEVGSSEAEAEADLSADLVADGTRALCDSADVSGTGDANVE